MAPSLLDDSRPVTLIVGASSGIGAALARELSRRGHRLALVARSAGKLEALSRELSSGGDRPAARWYAHDVRRTGEVEQLFDDIWRDVEGIDNVVTVAGIMPPVGPEEYDIERDRLVIETNLTGNMAWLNAGARRFQFTGRGTLAGVSSVAGDRGRRGHPAYAASKAGLSCFLEALRNRLAHRGVRVVTIKPGPVATPMTEGLGRLPLIIPAEAAARQIADALESGPLVRYVPPIWRWIMLIIRAIPGILFRRLSL